MNRPLTRDQLILDMTNGYQTSGVNFLQHGQMVADRFDDLMGEQKMQWRLPAWFNKNKIVLSDVDSIKEYQIFHDCGKPYCRTVDDAGKMHYPDHATVSAEIWQSLGGSDRVVSLITRDMECHLLRPADASAFAMTPDAMILLLTALCEVHTNASMFGGLESDSFKIKWKRLDKCGSIIMNNI